MHTGGNLQSQNEQRNWAGNHTYAHSRFARPTSLEALRKSVLEANHVRVVATRHSFNELCDSDGLLIDVSGMASKPAVDVDRRLVTVTAGTAYTQVFEVVHAAGPALPNTGSLPHISTIGAGPAAAPPCGRSP
jgi:xylitol oxidase